MTDVSDKAADCDNKKLSCRRETARGFMSLNIFVKSLKVIANGTIRKQ